MTARDATPRDYAAFARLFPELGTGERVLDEAAWCAQQLERTVVVEEGGEVVAYAWWRHGGEDIAHVGHVVVAPALRGRRIADALLLAVAERARAAGLARWQLNVKPDNVAALSLYARWGFVEEGQRSTALAIRWRDVARLPAAAIACRVLDPADDAAVELALGFRAGVLVAARGRDDVPFVRADSSISMDASDGIVGVARFDPAVPGALPFRASSPAAARALLEWMRPRARLEDAADAAAIRVAVSDAALTRALIDAGATVSFEVILLRAPLPPPGPIEQSRARS